MLLSPKIPTTLKNHDDLPVPNADPGEAEPQSQMNRAGTTSNPGCLADDSPPPLATSQGPHSSKPAINLEELAEMAHLEDIKLEMGFIGALQVVSIDDEHNRLSKEAVEHLQNPPTAPVDVSNPDFHLGLDLFLTQIKSSQETYTSMCEAILHHHPKDNIPCDQMKHCIAKVTGVMLIIVKC